MLLVGVCWVIVCSPLTGHVEALTCSVIGILYQVWAAVMATPFISDAVQQRVQERAPALQAREEGTRRKARRRGKGGEQQSRDQEGGAAQEAAPEGRLAPEGCPRCHRLKMQAKPMAAFR